MDIIMKVLAILLLSTALACYAQTAPTIKGHALGESLNQFIAQSNNITQTQLQKCRITPSVKNEDDGVTNRCDDFLHTANASPVSGTFRCAGAVSADSGYDAEFISKFVDGAGVPCFEFLGEVTFDNDKLVKIVVEFWHQGWSEVLPDLISKFGKPREEHVNTMQNGFGAKFDFQQAGWATSNYVLAAFEKTFSSDTLERKVVVEMTDTKYFRAQQSKKPRGSVLD
jgi:hypothetical protein